MPTRRWLSSGPVHPLFGKGGLEEYRVRFLRISSGIYLFTVGLVWVVSLLLPPGTVNWQVVYPAIGSGLLGAAVLWFFPWQRFHPNWLLTIAVLTSFQIMILVSATGGEESPFFLLYFFVIILSGAFLTGWPLIGAVALVVFSPLFDHLLVPVSSFNGGEHLLLFSVYVVASAITNLLFRMLRKASVDVKAQSDRIEALYEASRIVHAQSERRPLFEQLLEIARRATRARYAAIRTFDDSGNLSTFYHSGMPPEALASLTSPPSDIGILGAVNAASPPLRLADLTQDSRHRGFPPGHPPMKSFLGVPITSGTRLLGKFYLTEKEQSESFTKEDEVLLAALGRDAAVAIEKTALLEKVQIMAVVDDLTGLYNRRAFLQRLKDELNRASRHGRLFTLLVADIDHFKRINDTYGHSSGDAALQGVAHLILRHFRSTDFCVRQGGEEFAVLLPETGTDAALVAAERLRWAVEDFSLKDPGGSLFSLSISIGLASYPDDALTAEALIEAADACLYRAKRLGRNRVESRKSKTGPASQEASSHHP